MSENMTQPDCKQLCRAPSSRRSFGFLGISIAQACQTTAYRLAGQIKGKEFAIMNSQDALTGSASIWDGDDDIGDVEFRFDVVASQSLAIGKVFADYDLLDDALSRHGLLTLKIPG